MADPLEKTVGSRPSPRIGAGPAPGVWALEPNGSRIEFRVKHFWGLMMVQGHFTRYEGKAEVDPDGSISVTLRLEADALDTKQKQRDKHLRSADFFDVANHPMITFSSRRVTAIGADRLSVEGDLTVAGRGVPITFEARLNSTSGETVTVDAEIGVDRTAFGMTWSPLRMASTTALLVVHAQFHQAVSLN